MQESAAAEMATTPTGFERAGLGIRMWPQERQVRGRGTSDEALTMGMLHTHALLAPRSGQHPRTDADEAEAEFKG